MCIYGNNIFYDSVFVEQLKNYFVKANLIIGILGSGKSKDALNTIEYANKIRLRIISIIGYV